MVCLPTTLIAASLARRPSDLTLGADVYTATHWGVRGALKTGYEIFQMISSFERKSTWITHCSAGSGWKWKRITGSTLRPSRQTSMATSVMLRVPRYRNRNLHHGVLSRKYTLSLRFLSLSLRRKWPVRQTKVVFGKRLITVSHLLPPLPSVWSSELLIVGT